MKKRSITYAMIFLGLSMIGVFFISPDARAEVMQQNQEKERNSTTTPGDGLQIMTAVAERDRGDDYVMYTSWVLTEKGRVRNRMKYHEMRKHYRGEDGFLYKSVVRYTDPPNIGRRAYLVWNYKDREKLFWYYLDNMTVAKRTTNVEFLKPPAESDFSILDYIDVKAEEETHRFLKSETYENKRCPVVESIPLHKSRKYGKRISWIDPDNLIPLKIDYYDRKGRLWKTLSITWRMKAGLWFWKKAVVVNAQNDYKTVIIIDDIQVNVGLHDREFTNVALARIKF